VESSEFELLLATCAEVAEMFSDGVVFIGGIAVYLHAKNVKAASEFAEFTHDADFYISLADMGDLRDIEEVTANRRWSKHQMVKRGFEFDIYTERQSSLIVPYDAIVASSVVVTGIRLASPEHLMVLKLEAFADRKGTAKGDKDAKDVLRIATVMRRGPQALRKTLVVPHLRDEHIELMALVARGPHAPALARGSAKVAKQLRRDLTEIVTALGKPRRSH
jgi:hypothetical protein